MTKSADSLSRWVTMRVGRALSNMGARCTAPVVSAYDRAHCEYVQITDALRGILVKAKEAQDDRILLHFHGGAHCLGSVWWTRELVGRLSAATGATVVSVEYRLAPEHPFPAGLEDALTAWRWVKRQYPDAPVAVAGDSAGGNLCFALLVKLAQLQEEQPIACVTMSPWLLLDNDRVAERSVQFMLQRSLSAEGSPKRRGVVSKKFADAFYTQWHRGSARCVNRYILDESPSNPLVSPVLAPEELVRRFPPVLIHASVGEPLAADAKDMAALCTRCGVTAELELYPGSLHVFQAVGMIEKSKDSLLKIGTFLESYWQSYGSESIATREVVV
eukprot:TRINITY_DN22379_c0_g2_i1.p1 TRINITY_DN22379_c0_g2~~TRINITY_DN22379_c0_g2_i1.p1  ORF type:complete len:353 (-),score=42.01 TRINITY_DN22379_c0_g2_i1:200-1192(-)